MTIIVSLISIGLLAFLTVVAPAPDAVDVETRPCEPTEHRLHDARPEASTAFAALAVEAGPVVKSDSKPSRVDPTLYSAWPFDAAEARCRQNETARAMGRPVELVNSVWMTISAVDREKMGIATHRDGHVFTAPVGQFRANAFGLYDMHGNVWEWCVDWDKADYYRDSPTDDPAGPADGSSRIRRGGSWLHSATYARSAQRRRYPPDGRNSPIGFRVVLDVPVEEDRDGSQ